MVSPGREALEFFKSEQKDGSDLVKKKKKQDKERTGTRSDRQREKENKGAGERRGAAWRWLDGGAHSNEQVAGGREG